MPSTTIAAMAPKDVLDGFLIAAAVATIVMAVTGIANYKDMKTKTQEQEARNRAALVDATVDKVKEYVARPHLSA